MTNNASLKAHDPRDQRALDAWRAAVAQGETTIGINDWLSDMAQHDWKRWADLTFINGYDPTL